MAEYALLINNEFKEIRNYQTRPMNIPHKKVTWHDVIREQGNTAFTGLENDNWVIRNALPSLDEMKHLKLQELANIRWVKETGGTTFSGYSISTDPTSQTKYVGAVVGAQIDPNTSVNWKMSDGSFVELDATQIVAMSMTVRAHIQACFNREAELKTLIEAANNKETLDAIDITVDWP